MAFEMNEMNRRRKEREKRQQERLLQEKRTRTRLLIAAAVLLLCGLLILAVTGRKTGETNGDTTNNKCKSSLFIIFDSWYRNMHRNTTLFFIHCIIKKFRGWHSVGTWNNRANVCYNF